jgi:hypothetical protein
MGAYRHAADNAYLSAQLDDDFPILWPFAVENAIACGDLAEADRLIDYVAAAAPGLVTPALHAHLLRLRALVAMAHGDADGAAIDADLEQATKEFRDFGARFYLARTLLERARRLTDRGDTDAAGPLRDEAEEIFVELRANKWIAEVRGVSSLR